MKLRAAGAWTGVRKGETAREGSGSRRGVGEKQAGVREESKHRAQRYCDSPHLEQVEADSATLIASLGHGDRLERVEHVAGQSGLLDPRVQGEEKLVAELLMRVRPVRPALPLLRHHRCSPGPLLNIEPPSCGPPRSRRADPVGSWHVRRKRMLERPFLLSLSLLHLQLLLPSPLRLRLRLRLRRLRLLLPRLSFYLLDLLLRPHDGS
eukprot:759203-Hanusia_phi.AAC.1